MDHVQLAECIGQLAVHVLAGLAHDVVTRADDNELARLEGRLGLHTVEGGADDALGAVTRDGTAKLFGNGQTYAVRPQLQRVRQHSLFGGVVGEDVNGHKLADESVAAAKYLIIKRVLFDSRMFHCITTVP